MVTKKEAELDFEALLEKYDYKFQKGDLVKGIVCGFDSQGVLVDIGAKTTAVIPTYEAVDKGENVEDKFSKGQEGEFLIIKEEDEEGKFLLSKKKVDFAYAWKELEKAKAADETILGTVVNVVKGGILVEVSGVRGFIPSSQLRARETEVEVGSKLELKILSLRLQGFRYEEISKKLDKNTKCIDNSLQRIRKKVNTILSEMV